MKIYLFLDSQILCFTIPNEVSGSFSFDENKEEESKLINIEAKNNQWYIYATDEVNIISDSNFVSEAVLQPDTFYILQRNEKNYIILTEELIDKTIKPYEFDKNINLVVGKSTACNLIYPCSLIADQAFAIQAVNNQLVLTKNNDAVVYINDKVMEAPQIYLQIGDIVNEFGLKIEVLAGTLLINNPQNKISLNEESANLKTKLIGQPGQIKDIEVKEEDLYKKEDYFTKAPRLRRTIEPKEIDLDKPPKDNTQNEIPPILTLGPMFTMGIVSMITILSTLEKIYVKETTIEQSWPSLAMAAVMLITMLLWPVATNLYNRNRQKKLKEKINRKYGQYLKEKRVELSNEQKLQKEILTENLITINECLNIIQNKTINFWDKRLDQNDLLVVRIGIGNELLNVHINYPKEGFTIEESDLKNQADTLVKEYKYIENVPIGYSLYENKVTAIMANEIKGYSFINNMIIQLLTFYSYEDLKLVFLTNEQNSKRWEYAKYLNHTFTNDKQLRFFASTPEDYTRVSEYLLAVVNSRLAVENKSNVPPQPYYVIIIDDYAKVKRYDFIKKITETDQNIGFSLVLLENRLSNLPSKCNNFINLGEKTSGVLKNSYEKQEQIVFYDEINYRINMMEVAKLIANVPIEFESGVGKLPDSITFLEMEKVGKVKQLNILNRWNTNDTTTSLKAEIGVDNEGDLMYLDLHEKAHGPHGLVAGMTGSGKSEFIITYILSMAINYSPDDVSFVLIDYKGGGLAFAFENNATNTILPHLAGTITNLDKAEMDRTLVSIDSEVKKRQKEFNEAREKLGESTIDIYKYQKYFKEGKLSKPIPHLFIICDEFAELKSQQPDFMDNLISIARIGRSLGVHLILATQKPSGVVNDQIWSNSKFHVCLKVQDESDSNEMLKKPDAANLKQSGRFYLQVGYDEYFGLGQSAWCGAKYFPSDKTVKMIDKSVDFIDDTGVIFKKVQASTGNKIQAQGEQLQAILGEVISVAKECGKKAEKLWLDNIPETILIEDLIKKYNIPTEKENPTAIIGEYDAPEKQEQGLLSYSYLQDGNTIIYGSDGGELENFINSIIYSSVIRYNSQEINYYILDFGSQSLRRFEKLNHVGGVVVLGDEEKYTNCFKMLKEELEKRKKLLSEYGGSYDSYIKTATTPLPLKVVIMNNFDAINESDKKLYDELPGIIRDSERYGIIFMITASALSSVPRKISQSCGTYYALSLNDEGDYLGIFSVKKKLVPRSLYGRGVYKYGEILHEFQTASIIEDREQLSEFLNTKIAEINEQNPEKAEMIPCVPDQVTLEYVKNKIKTIKAVPIGINKNTIEIKRYDFISSLTNTISATKIEYTKSFVKSLLTELTMVENTIPIVLDANQGLTDKQDIITNYYNDNFDKVTEDVINFIDSNKNSNEKQNIIILIYGLEKYIDKLSDKTYIEKLLKAIKEYENASTIICDAAKKIKSYSFETWYSDNMNLSEGIFIGKGVADQNLLRINNYAQELMKNYKNDTIFVISEGEYEIIKAIEFEKEEIEEDEE